MYNEEKYINYSHGLELIPNNTQNIRGNENGILFLVEYYILKKLLGKLDNTDIDTFKSIVNSIQTYENPTTQIKGLYDRGAGESLNFSKCTIRKISHDNLTAISAMSSLLEECGMSFHKDIATYGLKHQMRYDNVYPDNPRWIFEYPDGSLGTSFQWNPRDWFFWLYRTYKFAWILFPIFFFSNIFTCLSDKQETSGKWLSFVRLESGSKYSKLISLNKKICYWILKKKYGKNFLSEMAKVYFWQDENHPIRQATKDIIN